jgi:hypothetical protein
VRTAEREAVHWGKHRQAVEDAIWAGNNAALTYLQRVETQAAVGSEDHQLAVEHDPVGQLPGRGSDDVGEPVADVVLVPRPQPRRRAVADDDDAAS